MSRCSTASAIEKISSDGKVEVELLKASEKEVVDQVLTQTSSWSLSQIESYLKDDMPIKISKENEMIDYEFALYREVPYSVRNYESDKT